MRIVDTPGADVKPACHAVAGYLLLVKQRLRLMRECTSNQ